MSIRKSLFFTALSANSLTALNIGFSMVIARLLTPSELGAYSVAAAIVGLTQQFRDFGTSTYIVQCKQVDPQTLGRVFGLTLLMAFAFGFITLIMSWPAATFYKSKDVGLILAVLGLNFFLIPFGSNTLALLRREMKFKERAIINQVSAVAGLVIAIALASAGLGPISLALGIMTSTVSTALCASYYRPKQYSWKVNFRGLGEIAKFGAQTTSGTVLGQVNRGVIEIIGGRVADLTSVAYYNKAKSVTEHIGALLMGIAGPVALPVLAKAHRHNEDPSGVYLRAIALMTGIAWPLCAFSIIFPLEILHFMYGSQWDFAAPMLRLLGILGIFTSPFWLWTQALLAVGNTKDVLKGELVELVLVVSALSGVLLAGSQNLALASLIGTPLALIYFHRTLKNALGYSSLAFLKALLPSAIVCAACVVSIYGFSIATENWQGLWRLVGGMTVLLISWAAAIHLSSHTIKNEFSVGVSWLKRKLKTV
ncbi:oligosaccharide flippase family protein [Paucibacter sp. B2R-40]|uniref:oligosaccharide flippase family protein n=1 Tax=Paucibacter sp. B2R-40 TaxID=2893554 RepID=UPI0021E40AC5|nr:oligosaccharide flippase family protein [Paucibacter sp. B2R-40]MCV2355498.1 oligosaccharide flippase family protein [Paucibacter sp. B2R-40]